MNIFRRLFKIGQSEAHAIIDKLEDPIKLTEQGIRDLKLDLESSLKALAEIKALAIRSRREAAFNREKADEYYKKAMLLVQKADQGQLPLAESDRLAAEALKRQQDCLKSIERHEKEAQQFDVTIAKLDGNIKQLKSGISRFETDLRTLKARAMVSDAVQRVNKQMAQIDSSSTVAMLERMRDKVVQSEALAEAYSEIADENKSLDQEIDSALGDDVAKASDALTALKERMGILPKTDF